MRVDWTGESDLNTLREDSEVSTLVRTGKVLNPERQSSVFKNIRI